MKTSQLEIYLLYILTEVSTSGVICLLLPLVSLALALVSQFVKSTWTKLSTLYCLFLFEIIHDGTYP